MSAHVLVVDDEANIRRMLASLLEQDDCAVIQAADGATALTIIADEQPDVVLLDLSMPGLDGLTVLERIAATHPALPVVMMSGRATLADAVRATKLGAFHFIEKPLTPEAVLLTVRGAIELRKARERTRVLTQELGINDAIIGESDAIATIRSLIDTVGPSEARVLITGESGTGKELVAAALHAKSPRANNAFVRVNSAAIPRELIESEMFGHEKGAFSGAIQMRRGKLEQADGGTLFLDEIADLGADAQAKLLRAIETGEMQRVGGEKTTRVNVRVLAATNRDLKQEVAAGRFRDDLFYRLNVIPIHLPPLRERLKDVPLLVKHFLARHQSRTGQRAPIFEPDAMEALTLYRWPGNVRELGNLIERIAILRPGASIRGFELRQLIPEIGTVTGEQGALHERLDAFERELIEQALDTSDGSVADAARKLQTDRPNLYRRMRRLGIDR